MNFKLISENACLAIHLIHWISCDLEGEILEFIMMVNQLQKSNSMLVKGKARHGYLAQW